MDLTKKRWLVLVASCLINLCIGSLYAWSVFAEPMAEYLNALTGRDVGSLAIVFTLANSVGPVTMISGGSVNDRLGPRGVIVFGGLLFGLGMFFSGFSSSVNMLMITYGLGVGLGMGFVYGCTVSNTVKFFPDRRGLAGGLTTALYGISAVLVPPIANALNHKFGVLASFKILGGAITAAILLFSVFIIRCPSGFVPSGWTPPASSGTDICPGKNWRQMLADPAFYSMILILCCGAFSGLMVISQASPIAQRMIGMSVSSAAAAVSVLALFNTAGRIFAGILSDRIGIVATLRIFFALSAVGSLLLALPGAGNVLLFYLGISAIGLGFGSIMGIFPGFTAAQFGAKNNSVNYGIMFIGFAAAGYFGPTIMSGIYLSQGRYSAAFFIAALLSIIGILLTSLYKIQAKQKRAGKVYSGSSD